MTIQHTANYGIAYMDKSTPLTQLDQVTQQIAESLDAAMGKAGYVPPDATTFAALAAQVTALQARLDGAAWVDDYSSAAQVNFTSTEQTLISKAVTVPAGQSVELEFDAPIAVGGGASNAYVILHINGAVVETGYLSTPSGGTGMGFPAMVVRGGWKNSGTSAASVTIAVTYYYSNGSAYVSGSAGGNVKVRHRVI